MRLDLPARSAGSGRVASRTGNMHGRSLRSGFMVLCFTVGCDLEPAAPPAPGPGALLERGRLLRERDDPAAAESTLAAGLAALPGDPTGDDATLAAELHLERGVARERSGDDAGAESDYAAAVILDPTLARAWNNRAALRARDGRLTAALADWDRALELEPRSVQFLLNRALARQEAGNYDGALADAAAADGFAPGTFGPLYRRGAALLAKGELLAALDPLAEAARRAGTDAATAAAAHRDRAAALRGLGRVGESAAAWAAAVAANPALARTADAAAAAALAATVAALGERGLIPTDSPPPPGFDLLAAAPEGDQGGDPRPVLIAEPAAGGAFVLTGEELGLLEATPAALVAVPTGDGVALHAAAEVFARGPRPVRFLVPPPATEAPPPLPAGG